MSLGEGVIQSKSLLRQGKSPLHGLKVLTPLQCPFRPVGKPLQRIRLGVGRVQSNGLLTHLLCAPSPCPSPARGEGTLASGSSTTRHTRTGSAMFLTVCSPNLFLT